MVCERVLYMYGLILSFVQNLGNRHVRRGRGSSACFDGYANYFFSFLFILQCSSTSKKLHS